MKIKDDSIFIGFRSTLELEKEMGAYGNKAPNQYQSELV
jgi:hypothetical protein